jgi:hypothetical protein
MNMNQYTQAADQTTTTANEDDFVEELGPYAAALSQVEPDIFLIDSFAKELDLSS